MQDDRIVIFDWGGVVLNLENGAAKYFEATAKTLRQLGCKLSDEEMVLRWRKRRGAAEIDSITSREELEAWLKSCGEDLGFDADYEAFSNIFRDNVLEIVPCYSDVSNYASSLKNRCKNGILSNLALFHEDIIKKQYNFADFNKIYLSYELGVQKPDHRIYKYIEEDLNLAPEKILFIDDVKENIIAAKERGWNVCHATGRELDKIKSAVEGFLK